MDASIAAGEASLACGGAKGGPGEGEVGRGHDAGFDEGATGFDEDGGTEGVAPGECLENLGGDGAEGAGPEQYSGKDGVTTV